MTSCHIFCLVVLQVYHIALALSTHLEQPNMGVTIWGFAILTKPLILAVISVLFRDLSGT